MSNCYVCKKPLVKGNIVRKIYCRKCYYDGRKNGTIQKLEAVLLPEKITALQKEILIGSILGDGCLHIHKNGINPYFEIGRSVLDETYLLDEYNLFKNFCGKGLYRKSRIDKRSGFLSKTIGFKTRCSSLFMPYYNEWYKNNKKFVSTNLKLTSTVIAIWLADDATIRLVPNTKSFRLGTRIATNSFPKEEVVFLCDLLSDRYNERFRITKATRPSGIQWLIEAADAATRVMLKDIDSVFPNGMIRKSSIWRAEEVRLFDDSYKIFKHRGNR